ncbi:hypothetical protein [Halostagnicola bangensis]
MKEAGIGRPNGPLPADLSDSNDALEIVPVVVYRLLEVGEQPTRVKKP